MKFSVGDRVRAVSDYDPFHKDELGTVCVITPWAIGVEWDTPAPQRHDLEGHCPMHYGWWCDETELERVAEEDEPEEDLTGLADLL